MKDLVDANYNDCFKSIIPYFFSPYSDDKARD